MSLNPSATEDPMCRGSDTFTSVKVQSPPVGMVWKYGEDKLQLTQLWKEVCSMVPKPSNDVWSFKRMLPYKNEEKRWRLIESVGKN
ncbi:hypothetical protein TNCV_4915431 [Trichonephila clavipes]|nr:hypothetical protein TNCV_4915431 [Trichonephila clavipes]